MLGRSVYLRGPTLCTIFNFPLWGEKHWKRNQQHIIMKLKLRFYLRKYFPLVNPLFHTGDGPEPLEYLCAPGVASSVRVQNPESYSTALKQLMCNSSNNAHHVSGVSGEWNVDQVKGRPVITATDSPTHVQYSKPFLLPPMWPPRITKPVKDFIGYRVDESPPRIQFLSHSFLP